MGWQLKVMPSQVIGRLTAGEMFPLRSQSFSLLSGWRQVKKQVKFWGRVYIICLYMFVYIFVYILFVNICLIGINSHCCPKGWSYFSSCPQLHIQLLLAQAFMQQCKLIYVIHKSRNQRKKLASSFVQDQWHDLLVWLIWLEECSYSMQIWESDGFFQVQGRFMAG